MARRKVVPADLQRWVASLTPRQLQWFQRLAPNAPSQRYGRSPQWQALARSIERRFPEWAQMRKGTGESAVGALYGTLRSLANPEHEATWKRALGLPPTATRQDLLAIVSKQLPELGHTPMMFEQTLNTVATMKGVEVLGLKGLVRDVEQQKREGRTWDTVDKLQTDAERRQIANQEQRRAMLGSFAAAAERNTPQNARIAARLARPHNSRMAELHAQYAARSGRRVELDPDSPGYKQWRAENPDPLVQWNKDAVREEIRATVEAADRNATGYEQSLRDSPAEAEAAVIEWEKSHGNDQ